jgi:Ca2+-binding EF-hand superfamily protein
MISRLHTMLPTALLLATAISLPLIANAQKSEMQIRTYSYDSNRNGFIEPEEFTTYFYSRSDADGDGYMGDEEWTVNTSQLYRPYKDLDYNKYTYWDQDKDGRLDNNEVRTLVEKTGLYEKWDTNRDARVDTTEFARGTFAAYDDNGDGTLSFAEWQNVLR